MVELRNAVNAVGGVMKMNGLFACCVQVPLVSALSRLTMRRSDPARSWLTVLPRAVVGSWVKRTPTAPAKCRSPPKAKVTAFPLPFQLGLSGEWAGNATALLVWRGAVA